MIFIVHTFRYTVNWRWYDALDQQFRVTRIMMESFHLYSDVESSRLRSYMMGYFTMMMAICSVLTKLSDED